MTQTNAMTSGKGGLPEMIRRELGADVNRRFLARYQDFRPSADTPDNMRNLLARLDLAEIAARNNRD